MRILVYQLLIWILLGTALFAKETLLGAAAGPKPMPDEGKENEAPWLTGPLISPFGYVIEKGHWDIEPYFYGNVAYGAYDKHWKAHSEPNFYSPNLQWFTWYGFAKRWDVEISPQFSWNHTSGASHWVVNDFPIEVEYQLLYEKPGSIRPAIKVAFLTTFPIGKYQKLDSDAKHTDVGGLGSWLPGIEIAFQRLVHLRGLHYLCLHYSLSYIIPTAVHVKGRNAYGGGHGTHGTVYPGPEFTTIFGLEYSLTRNWAFALDIQYEHIAATRFSGHKGATHRVPNRMGGPSIESLSLAPAIEYSWSANFGMIAGVWFTAAGRNSTVFANGIVAINVYI